MQHHNLVCAAVIISIAAASLFFIPNVYRTHKKHKLHVVATTSIIADAVRNIAGDYVALSTLMGPGVDPHSYHAKLSDMHMLLQADIVLYNGLHLEGKMAHILKKMERYKPTRAVASSLPTDTLIQSEEFDGIYDPHVWFDVSLWMLVIEHIAALLKKHDPEHAALFESNKQKYLEELRHLQSTIQDHLKAICTSKRYLVTTHDAFSYFGRAYGVRVIALQGINLDAEPCIIDMQELVKIICRYNIPTIFVESSLPQRSMQAICKAAQAQGHHICIGQELYSDALGGPDSGADSYIGMCLHNVYAIVKGLNSR